MVIVSGQRQLEWIDVTIHLVGTAQSYSTLPDHFVRFLTPLTPFLNFFHRGRRFPIILSQGISLNFPVQKWKRLHLASSLKLGWVRNSGRLYRGHGSEGGLVGVIGERFRLAGSIQNRRGLQFVNHLHSQCSTFNLWSVCLASFWPSC